MTTCENCVHYEFIKTESSSYCLCSNAFNVIERQRHNHKFKCDYFKDKSRYIELPCMIGDTVYYPWIYDDNKGIAFTEVESIKIYVDRLPLVFVGDWESDLNMPTTFYPENFGKTVFLTREEAEKALKEREQEG